MSDAHGRWRSAVGARVRQLRLRQGLTQAQLARPRYSAQFVAAVEDGLVGANLPAAHHFARGLGVSFEALVDGLEPEPAPPSGWWEEESELRQQLRFLDPAATSLGDTATDLVRSGIRRAYSLRPLDQWEVDPRHVASVSHEVGEELQEALQRRLEHRATETPEQRAVRLRNAEIEMAAAPEYDYVVVNEDGKLDQTVEEIAKIIRKESKKPRHYEF